MAKIGVFPYRMLRHEKQIVRTDKNPHKKLSIDSSTVQYKLSYKFIHQYTSIFTVLRENHVASDMFCMKSAFAIDCATVGAFATDWVTVGAFVTDCATVRAFATDCATVGAFAIDCATVGALATDCTVGAVFPHHLRGEGGTVEYSFRSPLPNKTR